MRILDRALQQTIKQRQLFVVALRPAPPGNVPFPRGEVRNFTSERY